MYDRISSGDIDGFGEALADDFVEHEETPSLAPTKDGVLEFFRMQRAGFPDLRMDPEDVLVSGDKVVTRGKLTGTHQEELMGIPRPARASTCSSSTSFGSATTVSRTSTGESST
jgi:predicted ester cyclase